MFLTEGYLGIVMEYVNGGDMADLVDTWNARNRRRRPPAGTVPAGTQCAFRHLRKPFCMPSALCLLRAKAACMHHGAACA